MWVHAAVSLALAWTMGLRGRWLALGVLAGLAPDFDHLPIPGLVSRGTTTNVFVAVALPLVAYAVARHRAAPERLQEFLLALPVLLLGHVVFDLLPAPPGGATASAALFYPLDARKYTVPAEVLSFARGLPVLVPVLGGLLLASGAAAARVVGKRDSAPAAVFAVALLAVLPVAVVANLLAPTPDHPNAILGLEEAVYDPATGAASARVQHELGAIATISTLRVEWLVDGVVVQSAMNPARMSVGTPWIAERPLEPALDPERLSVRLVAVADGHRYVERSVAA